MITLPTVDLVDAEPRDDGSTQRQVQRIVDAHALETEQKRAIYRRLFQHRVDEEMQRVTGKAAVPQGGLSHRLRDLVLVGSTGILGLLLIGLVLPSM